MALREPDLRALEASLLEGGVRPPSRPHAPRSAGPDQFSAMLAIAAREGPGDFVRHAGYHCGATIARTYVDALRTPNRGAERMVRAVTAAFPALQLVAEARGESHFGFAVHTRAARSEAFRSFADGFVRGASMRLNEGQMPLVLKRLDASATTWAVSVDWTKPAPEGARRPTGGRRRRRR